MSRLVTQDVDVLYVISDPSPRGLLTAKRIVELVAELKLNVGRIVVIVNRVGHDGIPRLAGQDDLEVSGFIRNDEMVTESDREGEPVFRLSEGSAALTDAYAIFDTTIGGKE
jgi:CO dehydrogenase maturation factor